MLFTCFCYLQSKDILGDELLECLYWRRGALLYMYCSTVCEDEKRDKTKVPLVGVNIYMIN